MLKTKRKQNLKKLLERSPAFKKFSKEKQTRLILGLSKLKIAQKRALRLLLEKEKREELELYLKSQNLKKSYERKLNENIPVIFKKILKKNEHITKTQDDAEADKLIQNL